MIDDVNDRVEADWTAETTPFERVLTVMRRTYDPQSAGTVASRARTSPTTARKHLRHLADSGFVEVVAEPGQAATRYRRSRESLVLEQARDILEELDPETLAQRIAGLQSEIDSYRETFDADSPEDAAVADESVDEATIRAWQTTRRNLAVARAALALANVDSNPGATVGV